MRIVISLLCAYLFISCTDTASNQTRDERVTERDTISAGVVKEPKENTAPAYDYKSKEQAINTGSTTPAELLQFANTLVGTPYKYGSIDPAAGFDCSGFITYVFSHFNITVPRSSIDFTNVQKEVPLTDAKPGDLVLFTGTDSTVHHVGHMGIISANDNNVYHFIHSTSGKSYGVTVTELNKYYMKRFVKIIRVFKQNDR
ncbi:MAG: hypothetical protein JWQ96_3021 [Segetibacter sp.]|nr:hypothetical protein [Segetibacter sp.]